MSEHKPENYMKPWTAQNKKQLKDLFESGMSVSHLAEKLGRTVNGIVAQLEQQKLIINQKGVLYKTTFWCDIRKVRN